MICPRCGLPAERLDALSRKDNQTHVCSTCGQDEAFIDAAFPGYPNVDWAHPEVLG